MIIIIIIIVVVVVVVVVVVGGIDVTHAAIRVWYSLCISEEDFSLLLSALKDLVTTELRTLTKDVMEISADQLCKRRDVWVTWLKMGDETKTRSDLT